MKHYGQRLLGDPLTPERNI